ncbi:hypothetical protein GCM10011390_51130 [Aureimonas endophytica]|uniref:Uncharacterized protein n=1 Tax=Aureimonas endophytica TaxID=2027858 RepID=A0A917A532_9HYPH|nr:hypothetical protein GCM10011390_51130 [Aureimonas endophytica]
MQPNTFISDSQFASLLDALVQAATTLINLPELIDRDALAMALAAGGICPASIRHDLERERRRLAKPNPSRRTTASHKSWERFRASIEQTIRELNSEKPPKPRIRVRAHSRKLFSPHHSEPDFHSE